MVVNLLDDKPLRNKNMVKPPGLKKGSLVDFLGLPKPPQNQENDSHDSLSGSPRRFHSSETPADRKSAC